MRTLFVMAFFLSSVSNAAFWWDDQTPAPGQNLLLEFGQAPKMDSKTEQSTFVLTSWNVYKGGKDGMHDDLELLIDQSDFVLMQEFLLDDQQNDQIQKMSHVHWALAKSFKDGGEWTGVAVASKWQPYESVPVRSPGTEPFADTPKMSLISKFTLPNGEDLWIVNTHALNFDITHTAFKEQIAALAEILKTHQGPMIWAGDFNTWSDVRVEYLLDAANSLGMEHAPIENPIGILSATLDHIFYRGFTDVKPSLLSDITTSDHNPLRLEFTIAAPAALAGN